LVKKRSQGEIKEKKILRKGKPQKRNLIDFAFEWEEV
jgi:hypothetical protein